MTATELDVDRTLELARSAREPSAVDERRVLEALRSRIVEAPEQLGGPRVRRLHLVVGEARGLRRASPGIEAAPPAECPSVPGSTNTARPWRHEVPVRILGDGASTGKDEAPPRR